MGKPEPNSLQKPDVHSLVEHSLREISSVSRLKVIEKLFLRLQAYYGTRFNEMWNGIPPEEIKATWADALSGFTVEQIGYALQVCQDDPYPPNLPTFIQRCRNRAIAQQPRRIAPPVMDRTLAKEMLAEVRRRYFSGKDLSAGERGEP